MSAHSRAPWVAVVEERGDAQRAYVTADSGRVIIATTQYATQIQMEFPTKSERAANARLIAAAPDLLKALKAMIALHGPMGSDPDEVRSVLEARAAIVKVEGGS